MGSITIQVIGDGTVGTKSKTYTVSDADVNRLVAFGKSMVGGSPTVTQGLVAWADKVIADTKSAVRAYENAVATAAITDISAT